MEQNSKRSLETDNPVSFGGTRSEDSVSGWVWNTLTDRYNPHPNHISGFFLTFIKKHPTK